MNEPKDINELLSGFLSADDIKRIDDLAGTGPIAVCTCGHTGGGPKSEHSTHDGYEYMRNGYGSCMVEDCNCQRFHFAHYTNDYRRAVAAIAKEARV